MDDNERNASSERAELTERILRLDSRVFQFLQIGEHNEWLAVDLTMLQLKVLLIVFGSDGRATASRVARGLGISPPTVTGIVDRLCEHGLVQRREDATDRRLTRLGATEEGLRLVDRLYRSSRKRFGRLLHHLDINGLRTVRDALELLYDAAAHEASSVSAQENVELDGPFAAGSAPNRPSLSAHSPSLGDQ